MNYPEIDQDLKLHLDELVEASFASDGEIDSGFSVFYQPDRCVY